MRVSHRTKGALPFVLGSSVQKASKVSFEPKKVLSGWDRALAPLQLFSSSTSWLGPLEPGRLRSVLRRMIDKGIEDASRWLEESQDFHPGNLLGVSSALYRSTSPLRHGDDLDRVERALLKALMIDAPAIFVSIRGDDGPRSEAIIQRGLERLLAEPTQANRAIPEGLPQAHHRVWNRLLECHDLGQPLVGLFLGDHHVESGTELLGRRMLSSAIDRRGHLRQLYRRDAKYRREIAPWLSRARPEVKAKVDHMVDACTAGWLQRADRRPQILGWKTKRPVDALHPGLQLPDRVSAERLADLTDTICALHSILATGVQSYWLKLMRESTAHDQRDLVRTLSGIWMMLNTAPAGPEGCALEAEFARLGLTDGCGRDLSYDRLTELRRVTTETLYGLGMSGERWVAEIAAELYQTHRAVIDAREALAERFVPGYRPVDFSSLHADPYYLETAQDLLSGSNKDRRVALERYLETAPPSSTRSAIGAHLALLRSMATNAALVTELNFTDLRNSDRMPVGEWIGACPSFGNRGPGRTRVPESVLDPGAESSPSNAPGIPTSAVFAGAGGRGPLFLGSFDEILRHLEGVEPGGLRVDEYIGASAGAAIAGLLAAGCTPNEVLERLRGCDFSRSLDDFFALGGVSPGVRGIQRNGLFSTRTMYDLVYGVMSEKLGITGRPILFKDLPHELKTPVIVVSTDMPKSVRKELGVDEDDREWLLSKSTTPYVDAVAAIVASGSPPPFFETPKLALIRKRIDESGQPVFDRYTALLADGGTSNKRPYSLAKQDDAFLMTFACVNVDGDRKVTTVDLSCQEVDRYVRLNREQTRAKLPGLVPLLEELGSSGYHRAILSFHMSTEPEPIGFLGASDADTEAIRSAASAQGISPMDPKALRASIEGDRIGVDLPGWAITAARFFKAPLDAAGRPPTWLEVLTAASSSISAAKRLRPITDDRIPRPKA